MSSIEFDKCWKALLRIEGIKAGDIEGDPGGTSKFGITEHTARRHGYDSRTITEEQAKEIAEKEYWEDHNFHLVAIKSLSLAFELFEFGYWAGPDRPIRSLQEGINAVAPERTSLKVDGRIGKETLNAIVYILGREKGEMALVATMNGEQYIHMKNRGEQAEYMRKIQRGLRGSRLTNPFDEDDAPPSEAAQSAAASPGEPGAA